MVGRRPRGLRPEEEALWQKVVEKAEPLHPPRKRKLIKPMPDPKPVHEKPARELVPFRLGQKAAHGAPPHDLSPELAERIAGTPVAMDRKSFTQMKRGRLKPEARIDLHGMTLAQAHPALNRFILDSTARGLRLVLVITGKGKSRPDHGPIPERMGVLKHQVPHWLNTPPLNTLVLQLAEAHVKHGGGGAYYVYLRKSR